MCVLPCVTCLELFGILVLFSAEWKEWMLCCFSELFAAFSTCSVYSAGSRSEGLGRSGLEQHHLWNILGGGSSSVLPSIVVAGHV